MRTYVLVTVVFFDIIATAQLVRLVLGWPVVIAGLDIPVWASGIAVLVAGSLGVWGMRQLSASRTSTS